MREGSAPEYTHKPRHARKVLMHIRPRPSCDRIRCKCENDSFDCRNFVARGHDSYGRNCQATLFGCAELETPTPNPPLQKRAQLGRCL